MLFFYVDDELKFSLLAHSYARKVMKSSRILSLWYHRSPSHLKLCLQKSSAISSQHHCVQSAAAALIWSVYITNELCSESATEPLVLRVCMPGAHQSSTWASGAWWVTPFSQVLHLSLSTFIGISCSSWTKLFHAPKTSGEKTLSAFERKTSQDKGSSDSGKVTSLKEQKYLCHHGVISRKSLTCQTGGVQAAEWMHPQRPRQSFQGLQQGGLYIKTVQLHLPPADPFLCCLQVLLIKTHLAGAWISHLHSFHSEQLRHLQLPRNTDHPSLHKEATSLCPCQIFWEQQHWPTSVNQVFQHKMHLA